MLLFFYGQDSYRSHQKLLELKAKYIDASLGDTNLTQLDVSSCTVDQLTNSLLAFPFLAKTRLVILDRLLSEGSKLIQEQFLDLIAKLPDTTVAVVYEPGVPDRRTVLFKTLLKQAKVPEFTPLVGRQLEQWMKQELEPYGSTIEPNAVTRLVELTAGDTWRLAMELAKLGATVSGRPEGERRIDRSLVESLVRDTQATNIFALGDAIASGSPRHVLASLRSLMRQGESPQYLVALVATTIRTLVLIRNSLDQGKTSSAAIATETGLKPFVISKHLQAARRYSADQLSELMSALAQLDLDSKRGRIEAGVGLELFVLQAVSHPRNHSRNRTEISV